MSILVCGKALALTGPAERAFEGVREVDGVVFGEVPRGPGSGRALLEATRVSCRLEGDICSAERCMKCSRFINYVPRPEQRRVRIRCYWSGDDSVRDLMTPTSAVVTVPIDAMVEDARCLAAEYDRDVLVVVDGEVLAGVVRRVELDWADPERPVTAHITRKVWMIGPDATLADLGLIVGQQGADCVLVVEPDGKLVGLVTRDDLRDVGWPG